jgi:hypothetical protein
MTRKDYVAIARALSNVEFSTFSKGRVLDALCDVFKQDNPRFNADRFIQAVNRKD